MNANGAIVCLTRGYSNIERYDQLIARNRSIYEKINCRRSIHHPLVIWHEGNISSEHQRHILSLEKNATVHFVDVSPVFGLKDAQARQDLLEDWSVGYRLMCRFQCFHVWWYSQHFDFIMRLDEDCILTTVPFDPIDALAFAEGDFAARAFESESHSLTNTTLPPFVTLLASALGHGPANPHPYNQVFPYTNMYVTRVGFWMRSEIQKFLISIVRNPGFLRFRWGDLPVLGVALNMFSTKGKVYSMPQIGYYHGSHDRQFEGKSYIRELSSGIALARLTQAFTQTQQ